MLKCLILIKKSEPKLVLDYTFKRWLKLVYYSCFEHKAVLCIRNYSYQSLLQYTVSKIACWPTTSLKEQKMCVFFSKITVKHSNKVIFHICLVGFGCWTNDFFHSLSLFSQWMCKHKGCSLAIASRFELFNYYKLKHSVNLPSISQECKNPHIAWTVGKL